MTIKAYEEHPIRATLEQLLTLRENDAMFSEAVASNEQHSAARDKVFAVADLLHTLLRRAPASLVSLHGLGQMHRSLVATLNEVSNFVSNKQGGHLVNAANQIEQQVLPHMWTFAPTVRGISGERFRKLVESVSSVSVEAVQHIAKVRDDTEKRFSDEQEAVEELSARLDDLGEKLSLQKAEAAAAVSKLEETFNKKEIERANAFQAAMKEFQEQHSALREQEQVEGSKILMYLAEQKKLAAEIVQVVGTIGVTGHYQRIANAEEKLANFWRWITIALFSGGIGLAVATFIKHYGDPVTAESLWSIAIRLFYALVIAAPAWYTASESARHRTNGDRARQTELELASLGPFIEMLPPDKRNEIREQMTSLYFGREIKPHESKPPVDMKGMREFAVELVKAVRSGG